MVRALLVSTVFLAWFVACPAAGAAELAPSAFFGHYLGSALSKTEDTRYLGFEMRDLDVTIGPEGEDFQVAWITLRRKGPDQPKEYVKRTERALVFLLTEEPGVYRPAKVGAPLSDEELSWARIEDRSLIVYLMTISAQGIYEIQSYTRTLGVKNLKLLFTRIRDGERVRKVSGKLRRVGD